jgi:CRP/FNR family transcriptional regulator, cyclic AMP receptor protein
MLSSGRQLGQPATAGSFCALLEPGEWSALAALGRRQTFAAGAVLMYEGEPGDRVMILLSGRAKAGRVAREGTELLLSILDPGDIMGELSFLDREPRLNTVTALEPAEALIIAEGEFRSFLQRTPRVTVVLLESLTSRFRQTTLRQSQFGALDTIGRLASRLVELAERYGERCEQGTVIAPALTQEDLRAWTGASAAAVAKALQQLRELGWIETHRRRIVIRDLDALRKRAS